MQRREKKTACRCNGICDIYEKSIKTFLQIPIDAKPDKALDDKQVDAYADTKIRCGEAATIMDAFMICSLKRFKKLLKETISNW
jgi:hypothetical protein